MRETLVKTEEFKDSPIGRIPQDWKVIKLGDVTDIENGTTPSREEPKFWSEGAIPWLTTGKVHDRFINQADEFITEYALRLCSLRLLPIGAVLVAMIGQGLTRGKVAYLAAEASINQNFGAILPCPSLDSRFLFHYLDFNYEYVRGSSRGSNQQALNCAVIAQLQVVCPPKEEQRRIAAILDTMDEVIARTSSLIAKLKQMKAGLLHDLLTRGLDENRELRDATRHPEQFKDSPLGRIPKDWEIRTCESVCREIVVGIVIKPSQYYQSSGVPTLRSANVREAGLHPSDLVFISEQSSRLLAKSMIRTGDVLTVRTGYPGTSCVVPPEFDGANCVDIIISRPGAEIESAFLATWINSDLGRGQVLRVQGGLAQQHFNVGELQKLLIAKPSIEEQQAIQTRLEAYETRIRIEEAYRDKLKLQKQGLMHDLLTGKVRVDSSQQLEEKNDLARPTKA